MIPYWLRPFRFKYWVVREYSGLKIIKARFFLYFVQNHPLLEGPFNTMEDAEAWVLRWQIRHVK